MKYFALVPVKDLARAKSRLAKHLSQQQREMLVLDMLHHVVSTLCESELFEQVYVVSADVRVLELAQDWGAEPLRETRSGHNPALSAAALTLLEHVLWQHKVFSTWTAFRQLGMTERKDTESAAHFLQNVGLLTISADLPLLTQEDIRGLVQEADTHQVVLASSSDGTGTNALLTHPPLAVPYLFGPHSLSAYIQAIQTHQLSYILYHNSHLAFDIDTPEDLHKLDLACFSSIAAQ
jgi:2-phospho-L-lactate/phosphoenolpyruvate guanylyltransferase